jgi:hypothetical protein
MGKNTQKKSNKYALRILRGGGNNAPDVVTQYINPMGHQMSRGLEGTANIFQKVFAGPGPSCYTDNSQVIMDRQTGGGSGYTIDFNTIDKVPTYIRYDDQAPPVLLNGKMHFSNCDINQCGGGKISLYKVKQMTHRKSKSRRLNKKGGRKTHSKRRVHRSKKRVHRGGDSAPASFYSNDMSTRNFECKQPVWDPKCI